MKKIITTLITISATLLIINAEEPQNTQQATINEVVDSLGNVQTNSWATGDGGGWPEGVSTPIVVHVGDTIEFTVDATDLDGGVLEYKFTVDSPSGGWETKQDWSTSNTFTWDVNESEFGPNVIVIISVRDDDGVEYMGTGLGDDYTYATYDVNNSLLGIQATIDNVVDSLGNEQNTSWATGGGGGWPEGVSTPIVVHVGDSIDFEVNATDPDGGVLEYKFAVDYEIKQDWNTSNTFTWDVNESEFGPNKIVHIAVRDDDGAEYMGTFNGDDYTYATYDVNNSLLGPQATINEVVDSLGNVQTNSWAQDEGGSWPEGVSTPIVLNVGDTIDFTVDAADPDGGTLEYKFTVQAPGASFDKTQDWSTSNTFTWDVDASEFGPNVIVLISVRDDDGVEYMGTGLGDDYTYATYNVNHSLGPVYYLLL